MNISQTSDSPHKLCPSDPGILMEDLKFRSERCRFSFTKIIARVRSSSAGSPWARTSENSWINQRTRLKIWVADLISLNSELEREQQSCVQAFDAAGFSGIIGDLEQDLAAVLEIANGERLPYEEQQPVEPEEADQLSDEGDEEFYEIPERLQAIEDVIDRLFRASNSQFDRILLFQSANTRPQPERSEQQARDKGKGKAAQKPQTRLTDASNLPAQTSLAMRPRSLKTYLGPASSASIDSRPEHVVPIPTPIAVAAEIDKPPRIAPVMEWRSRLALTEATRELDQQEATPSSSATSPPQRGRYFSLAGLPTGGGGGGPEMMVATREGSRSYSQYGPSRTAVQQSDFDYQSSRPATGHDNPEDRLSASFYRHRYGLHEPPLFTLPDVNQEPRVLEEVEHRSYSSADLESPPYQVTGATEYFVRANFQAYQREFFRKYRVLALQPNVNILEPAPTEPFDTIRDEDHLSVCRFVVVIEEASPMVNHFTALPILTYGGQGVAAEGVMKKDHGIVYTGDVEPQPDRAELPSRAEAARGMLPNAIRISPKMPTQTLNSMSRINYGQPTKVPLSAKVLDFGVVHKDSRTHFATQYAYVHREREQRVLAGLAVQYQGQYQKLKDKGQSHAEILQYLAQAYQRSHSSLSLEQASVVVNRLLEQ